MFALLLALPCVAHASDEDEFEMARALVDGAQYAEAAARFARMLDPGISACTKASGATAEGCRLTDAAVIQRARGLYSVALHALNRPNEAKDQFKQLLRENPTFSPSPALYPPKAIILFTEAKKEIEAELTAATMAVQKKKALEEEARKKYEAWTEEVERLASVETVVETRSRWIAAIPFGVGQFQNDNVGLGALFMTLEGAATVTTIVTGVIHSQDASCGSQPKDPGCNFPPDYYADLDKKLEVLQIVNIVSGAALAVAIVAGVIEAQASFVGEKTTTRKRKLPPKPLKPPPPAVGLGGVPDAPEAIGLGITLTF